MRQPPLVLSVDGQPRPGVVEVVPRIPTRLRGRVERVVEATRMMGRGVLDHEVRFPPAYAALWGNRGMLPRHYVSRISYHPLVHFLKYIKIYKYTPLSKRYNI